MLSPQQWQVELHTGAFRKQSVVWIIEYQRDIVIWVFFFPSVFCQLLSHWNRVDFLDSQEKYDAIFPCISILIWTYQDWHIPVCLILQYTLSEGIKWLLLPVNKQIKIKANCIGHMHIFSRCHCGCNELLVFLAPTVQSYLTIHNNRH
jgi:hypothetical protein